MVPRFVLLLLVCATRSTSQLTWRAPVGHDSKSARAEHSLHSFSSHSLQDISSRNFLKRCCLFMVTIVY
jgi:hypothetical protein